MGDQSIEKSENPSDMSKPIYIRTTTLVSIMLPTVPYIVYPGRQCTISWMILLEKAAVFIDGGFFVKVLGDLGSPTLDYAKFSDNLCNGYQRLRSYYYDCLPYRSEPPTPDEQNRYARKQSFVDRLQLLPRFEVKLGRLAPRGNGKFQQKKVDVLFSVDIVQMSWAKMIDRAIIITGDSDFVPAVDAAKQTGVIVELYYYKSPNWYGPSTHDELIKAVDERSPIDIDLIDRSLQT